DGGNDQPRTSMAARTRRFPTAETHARRASKLSVPISDVMESAPVTTAALHSSTSSANLLIHRVNTSWASLWLHVLFSAETLSIRSLSNLSSCFAASSH